MGKLQSERQINDSVPDNLIDSGIDSVCLYGGKKEEDRGRVDRRDLLYDYLFDAMEFFLYISWARPELE